MCVLGSREGWLLYPESELLAQGGSDTQGDMVLPADGLQQIPVLPPYLEESQDLGQARPGERKRKGGGGAGLVTKVRVYHMEGTGLRRQEPWAWLYHTLACDREHLEHAFGKF